jgi:hypothetical protein
MPVRCHSTSRPSCSISACIPSRFARPSASSSASSSGQRDFPFSAPCVRLASTKPPLRPEAAHPTRSASISVMREPGLRCAACRAVHNPAYPPPTTSRSQRTDAESRGNSGRGMSSHIEPNAVLASDRSIRSGSTCRSKTVSTGREPTQRADAAVSCWVAFAAAGAHPGGPKTKPSRSRNRVAERTSRAMATYSRVCSVQMLNVLTGLVRP